MQSVSVPLLPLTGGCKCGQGRYRLHAEPLVFHLCHCKECQRQTSSAFGESLRFDRTALEIDCGLEVYRHA